MLDDGLSSPMRAFAMAIFLVFGTMLFSCQTTNGQVMGDVAIEKHTEKNTVKGEMKITGDTVISIQKKNPPVMGGAKYIPQDSTKTITKCVKSENPEIRTMGEVMWIPQDTAKPIPPVIPKDTVIEKQLMGKVAFVPVKVPEIKIDSNNNKILIVNENKSIEIVVYPNPSKGEIAIRYTLTENTSISIDIYDVKGKKVKTLVTSPKMYPGIYNSSFNISELSDGIYFCSLKTGEKIVSTKITVAK